MLAIHRYYVVQEDHVRVDVSVNAVNGDCDCDCDCDCDSGE